MVEQHADTLTKELVDDLLSNERTPTFHRLSRTELHERARELSKKLGQTKRFVDAVDQVVDRLRRKDDPPLIANLLMRAGDALEHDANDLRGAANL